MAVTSSISTEVAQPATVASVRFETLDSWRGICALLVAVFHMPLAGALAGNQFIRGSYLFVDFFFVLSGFVIAHAYGARLMRGEGLAKFMVTRFGRLFPLHAFMLLAFLAFEFLRLKVPQLGGQDTAFTGGFTLNTLLDNALMIHGLGFEKHLSWNAPSWSISTEFFAYLLFAILVVGLRRTSLMAFAIIVAVAPIMLLKLSPHFMDTTYDFGIIRCIYGFSLGVLVQAYFARSHVTLGNDRETKMAWTAAELATIFAVVMFVANSHDNAASLLAPFVFGFAVLVFSHEAGYISTILRARPFILLGALSYSIYMTHLFVQGRMFNIARYLDGHHATSIISMQATGGEPTFAYAQNIAISATIFMILLTLIASIITYNMVEKPGQKWFRKLASKLD
jgi:peptidoglycan/LPS O-acetylase OafA/YrhL